MRKDTTLGRKNELQWRKERSGVRIRPRGKRWASVEERKVSSQDTSLGRKDGLTSVEERKVRSQEMPRGRKKGLQ